MYRSLVRCSAQFWFVHGSTYHKRVLLYCGTSRRYDVYQWYILLSWTSVSFEMGFCDPREFVYYSRKINIWSAFILLSPFLGPLCASFIDWRSSWRWPYYLLAMLNAICWILVITFMDETYYNRRLHQQPPRKSRLLRLVGTEQWRTRGQRSSFGRALLRPFVAIVRIPVLMSFAYYTFIFAWVMGLNTQISVFLTNPKLYAFNDKDVGQCYNFLPLPLLQYLFKISAITFFLSLCCSTCSRL